MKMSDTTNTTKKQKIMSSEDEQMDELAVAGPSHELSSPKIFKLDNDCFNEIFEYLSMKDLHSVGETCKTMQQVAGDYFKLNYKVAETICLVDGIYTSKTSKNGKYVEYICMSAFNEFMPCISYYHNNKMKLKPLQYLQSHIDEFQSTNHIHLVGLQKINEDIVEFIENLLQNIEIVQIKNSQWFGNFYELMLKYCENLKCIYLQCTDSSFNGKHEWLLQEYPMLEQLELIPSGAPVINELNAFFQRNPNVQRFSTSVEFLWSNRNEFLESNTKLDVLEIKEKFSDCRIGQSEYVESIWDLLNQLHKRGFYKRLFIYTNRVDENLSIKLNSVPDLELLCIRRFERCFNLPLLTNLKELIILDGLNATDAQHLANGLVKLERLYVDKNTIENILPFIRQSTKLNKIKMLHKDIKNEDFTDWRVLNLTALNNEREQLTGARKLRIFVRDDVFVATKWAVKNGDINLSLIEMRRSDSFKWNHHF